MSFLLLLLQSLIRELTRCSERLSLCTIVCELPPGDITTKSDASASLLTPFGAPFEGVDGRDTDREVRVEVEERVTFGLRLLVKDEVRTGLRTTPLPW